MPPTLGLDLGGGLPAPVDGRLVEVAVDAPAGPGPRTYTYLEPPGLGDLEPGEAVLVPFGRGGRQAIGIVVGEGTAPEGGEVRSIAARVRSDGPLLPALSLAFAAELSTRYLAPLAVVIRAMLPPGMLERLELMAEVTPAGEARMGLESSGLSPLEVDLLDELAGRARAVRDLTSPEGRAALLRRLRALADEGLVELTWTLLGAAVGPRYERRLWVTDDGLAAAGRMHRGRSAPGTAAGAPPEGGPRGAGVDRSRFPGRACRRRPSSSDTAHRPSPDSSAAASCAPRSASGRAGPSRAGPPRPAARDRRDPR